jgi:hypothetical protein
MAKSYGWFDLKPITSFYSGVKVDYNDKSYIYMGKISLFESYSISWDLDLSRVLIASDYAAPWWLRHISYWDR